MTVRNASAALSEEEQPPGEIGESSGSLQLSASSGSGRASTIVARGQLNDVWCDDMLIDTGASCSFARLGWVRTTRLPMVPLKQHVTVTLADQRTVVSTHEVQVQRMSVHGSVAACTLLVMDELSNDVIVGLNWQRQAGLAIKPGREHDLLNGERVAHKPRTKKRTASAPAKSEPTPTPTTSQPTRVRLAAALLHLTREVTLRAAREEALNHAAVTRKASTIDEAAAGNARLRDVLQRHQRVFTEELPIKTAEQIAASKQFSIVLIGDEVRPVKQRERRVSPAEVEAATKWVQEEVAAGRMEPSTSEWAAQLVIVPKRNDKGEVSGWRICGDYRNLNDVTKADAEPLPLMQMAYDRLAGMQYFSKLDLLKGFNQIPVELKSREYMAVSTPVGLYQPTVMPFGVKNAPGSFQREMRRVLRGRLNKGVFVFIDDIIIWSRTEEEHLELIDWVLSRLEAEGYYAHPGKCQFLKSEVNFLGHMVSRRGVSMQQHKVQAVKEWPALKSVRDVRAFLGLAGFYRRFVKDFAAVAKPLTDLTCVKLGEGWHWGREQQRAFDTLKRALVEAPILAHPDPQRQWIVETDASGFAIGGILSQKQDDGTVRPVAYWSSKLTSAPRNYGATERELMAIVEACRHWREYLFGSPHPILLRSDHKPLTYLNRKAVLGMRLNNWMERLSDYTFEIGYVKGKDNGAADALSRRSDHEVQGAAERAPVQPRRVKLMDGVTAKTWRGPDWRAKVMRMNEQSPSLAAAQRKATPPAVPAEEKKDYSKFTELWLLVENLQDEARAAGAKDEKYQVLLKGDEKHDGLRRVDGLVLSRTGAVYVPDNRALKTKLVELAHFGHFGRDRTLEHLARHCYWWGMSNEVEDFVRGCRTCQATKTPNHLPAGKLQPLPIPNHVWDSVGVDFIGPFPKSTGGHDFIMVLIDRLSKMVKLRACNTTITSAEAGRLLLDMMLDVGKLPTSIVSDRDVRFTAAAWGQLWRGLKTDLKMSTAYHPQTDGQTERMNRTLITMLQAYTEKRADWEDWLPFVAAAYNSTKQESTGFTPFEMNFPDPRGVDPLQWAMAGQRVSSGEADDRLNARGVSVEAERTLTEMQTIWEEVRTRLVLEQAKQKKYADERRSDVTYAVGDQVMLSTENLKTTDGKLTDKYLGPYVVSEVREGGRSVRLALGGQLGKVHEVFHVSQLKRALHSKLPWTGRDQHERPVPEMKDGVPEWEVEAILDKRVRKKKITWTEEPAESVVRTKFGRASKAVLKAQPVVRSKMVEVTEYKVKWLGWDEAYCEWKTADDLPHAEEAIAEYELTKKRSNALLAAEGDEKAEAAVVQLGVATVVEWRLSERRSTSRRGQPTVRCSYLSASAVVPQPSVSVPVSVSEPVGVSVVQAGGSAAVCGAVQASSDPRVLGWSVERSRAVAKAWTSSTKPLSP